MRLICTPQIPATYSTWRSARGELSHTIVCKATYVLLPGNAILAPEHEELYEADRHWDDNEQRSLRIASDLAPFKRRADVVVVGSVFAVPGTTARRVVARVAIGPIDKAIVAFSDRSVNREGIITEGRPFSRMALVYERSRGGEGTSNPAGKTLTRNSVGRLELPNFQPIAFEPEPPDFAIPSVGLGPIAAYWPSRMQRLGGHAALPPEAVLERPEDVDAAYFNMAPADQQLDELASNAHLILEGLHAEHPRLVTRLPGHRARALVDQAGIDIQLVCDTLWIDSDRGICTLSWRGSFRAQNVSPDERIIVALEGADMHRTAAELRKSVPSGEETLTLKPRRTVSMPEQALPFGNTSGTPIPFNPSLTGTPFQAGPTSVRPDGDSPPVSQRPLPSPPPPSPRASAPVQVPPPPAPPMHLAPVARTPMQMAASAPLPMQGPLAAPAPMHAPPAPQRVSAPAIVSPSAPPPSVRFDSLQTPAYLASPRSAVSAPMAVAHDARAATGGVASASDAAARSHVDTAPKPSQTPTNDVSAEPAKRPQGFIDLLWFDPEVAEKIRLQASWSETLKAPSNSGRWLNGVAAGEAAKGELQPVRYVSRAMARVAAVDVQGVQQAIANAVDLDGVLVRPLVVIEGELSVSYSPIEALRTTIALAEPLSATDKKLKEQLDLASDMAKPERRCTHAMIEAALARLRAAFQAANKVYPANYLEATTEQTLIEERGYLKRSVLGGPKILASLSPGAGPSFSLYLPEAVSERLPLLARFRARLIAEPHARQETSDTDGIVLVALALGRVVASSSMGS